MDDDIEPDVKKYYYDAPKGSKFDEDRNSERFWFGPVVDCYTIAEYSFLEYRETNFHNGPDYGQLTGRRRFAIYINGHSISISGASLDQALVVAIAFKRDGCNSQAAKFFWKATRPTTTTKEP